MSRVARLRDIEWDDCEVRIAEKYWGNRKCSLEYLRRLDHSWRETIRPLLNFFVTLASLKMLVTT